MAFLFLSPPKNFPIWSRRPGFFFLRPSPNAACPEPLADAIFVLEVCLCQRGIFEEADEQRRRERTEKEAAGRKRQLV